MTLRVEHAATLEKALAAQGYETMLLVGSDLQRVKREKLRMLGSRPESRLPSWRRGGGYVGEGFDDDRPDSLFMVGSVFGAGSWRNKWDTSINGEGGTRSSCTTTLSSTCGCSIVCTASA